MQNEVKSDHLALIRIEGMHCHKCETTIQKAISARPGVHEVEVDFNSGQVSVLFDHAAVSMRDLVDSIAAAGYHALAFTERVAT